MAVIELNVMIKQCLDRRIENINTARCKVAAWQTWQDQLQAKNQLAAHTDDACIKLSRPYPTFKA